MGRWTKHLRWVVFVTVGETLGFGVAAIIAVWATNSGVDDMVRFVIAMGGGAIEGAVLGLGQWLGLGRPPRPGATAWIGATAVAAAGAWALGMTPSAVGIDLGNPLAVAALGVGALALLASIPFAQWLIARRRGTARWIPVNMGAWAVGILWTFAPSPFIDESSPLALVIALYVVAGVLMAATVAVLTASTAIRLFGPDAR